MTVEVDHKPRATSASVSDATDYLGLTPEQRYEVISQKFPEWLLKEPIRFPPHHPTYGWACRVDGCDSGLPETDTRMLCNVHTKQYRRLKNSMSIDEFVRTARPSGSPLGWALRRRPDCGICGANREAQGSCYCPAHFVSLWQARQRGISEAEWRRTQRVLPPCPACSIPRCVHDGSLDAVQFSPRTRLCRTHWQLWRRWLKASGSKPEACAWESWSEVERNGESVAPVSGRGEVTLAALPTGLQHEIRYGIHRHANAARRTQWRPSDLQKVVNALAEAGVATLSDPIVAGLGCGTKRGSGERRIWLDLPVAARSLSVTSEIAKAEGWFDPILVGAAPFHGNQGDEHRRKAWNLTAISQHWLRDLLWDYLEHEALRPQGRRLGSQSIYRRISGITLLSRILRQNRADQGEDPSLLMAADAKAVKDTWDLWHREQIEVAASVSDPDRLSVLTETNRAAFMSGIHIVLEYGRRENLIGPSMDSFILGLPEYSRPSNGPRPRPLSCGDFQLLVSEQALAALDTADKSDIGFADIWLTHAFQGGRIGETLRLRLECVGLVGAAQPYIWRDISKANIIDYGMPCHLPVYQRLLRRQSLTRAKLRARYTQQLAALDKESRAQLEAKWDREMPLFPRVVQNPDLILPVSQCWFRLVFLEWLKGLGLSGITTHQTRATLATSLLNNGAPAALVRQLLGHISEESLAHYARYSDDNIKRHLQQVWAAGPGMDKPGAILLRPADLTTTSTAAAAAHIDLTAVPVEHGLCRYGPVVGGKNCPFKKNCTNGPNGPCEHFVLTGADLAYWERKREAAFHFAEGAPTDEARDYILSQWHPWDPVLIGLRQALDELGLLKEAEKLDLRSPVQDYFNPLFSTGWTLTQLDSTNASPNANKGSDANGCE